MDSAHNEFLARKTGEIIKKYIDNSHGNEVISLDGEWGAGKTHFCEQFQKNMLLNDYNCIVIDAFKCDFYDDALIAILASVSSAFSENATSRQETVQRMSQLAVPLIKSTAKGALKAVASKYMDLEVFDNELAESISDGSTSALESILISKIEEFNKRDESISSLKSMLENKAVENDKKGLIVVIDELDRCRPVFSLEIIEKIKHVFSCANVSFLLSMNKKQMYSSIRHLYGVTEEDSQIYLNKFITRDFFLNNEKWNLTEDGISQSAVFHILIEYLSKNFTPIKSKTGRGYAYDDALKAMTLLICHRDFKAREGMRLVEIFCKITDFVENNNQDSVGFYYGIFVACMYLHDNDIRSRNIASRKDFKNIKQNFYKKTQGANGRNPPMIREALLLNLTDPMGDLLFQSNLNNTAQGDDRLSSSAKQMFIRMGKLRDDQDYIDRFDKGVSFAIDHRI